MRVLDERLEKIKEEVVELHGIAKNSVELCIDALFGDENSAVKIDELERYSDILNTDIENEALGAVALFQPVARDLRFLATIMRISGNYERIVDYALKISRCRANRFREELEEIRKVLLEMFDILGSALQGDVESIADKLMTRDDMIDRKSRDIIDRLKGEEMTDETLCLIFSARFLERIGDILAKTGARILYIEKGRRVWIK
ncbi:phosphate signaling complex PhoU family protein [Geoglobus acetivorans]|uniref:Phosphate transport system regulatory protein PhoU n=1 Tax=Geoglobus acetivorans TaxID=565033 RepID=A0A0A7GCT8_GEOAI|nr:Phosphate transport system regulatory protein PhoU [Geoglobus acetivorans]